MKTGELTLNYGNPGFLTEFMIFMQYEPYLSETTEMAILFDDGTIFGKLFNETDIHSLMEFYHFTSRVLPVWFKNRHSTHMYFYKEPTASEGANRLDFRTAFKDQKQVNHDDLQPSYYNCIYFSAAKNKDVFALVKTKSPDKLPRYFFAYDEEEFSKYDIVCLLQAFFGGKETCCVTAP